MIVHGNLGLPFLVLGLKQSDVTEGRGSQALGGGWGVGGMPLVGSAADHKRGSCTIPGRSASHARDLGSFKSCYAKRTNRGNTLHLAFGLKV